MRERGTEEWKGTGTSVCVPPTTHWKGNSEVKPELIEGLAIKSEG